MVLEQVLPSVWCSEARWPPGAPAAAQVHGGTDSEGHDQCESRPLHQRHIWPTRNRGSRCVSTALQGQKVAQTTEQAKLVELEAAAKAAAEAVENAKQKAVKRQEDIDRLQGEYDQEVSRLVQFSDSVTHLQKSLRDAFQALSGSVEAQPSPLTDGIGFHRHADGGNAPSGGHRQAQRRHRHAANKGLTVEAAARACTRSLEGLPDESEAKKQKFVEYIEQERRVSPPQAALQHDQLLPQARV